MKLSQRIKTACVIGISFVAASANGAAIDNYAFEGIGLCMGYRDDGRDANWDMFSKAMTFGSDYQVNAELCAVFCIDNTPPEDLQFHVGFHFGDGSLCRCLFTDGNLPTPNPGGVYDGDGTTGFYANPYFAANRCWAHSNYGVAPPTTLETLSNYMSALVFNDDCNVSFNSPTDVQLQCSFDSTEGAATKVEIRSGSCDTNGGFNEEAQGDATTDATASASINIASVLTVADKNSGGPFMKEFCIRGDVLADDGSGLVSVGAKKFDLDLSLIYETSGTFNVQGIQTSAFSADGASASANRSDNLDTYQCNENGERDNTSLTIGDILYTCIESNDADVSVDITQLLILKNDGLDSAFAPPVTPINNSVNSFVTVKNCAASTGPGKNKCIVSTLMIPLLYDGQTDSSIKVSGTASLTYSRRRLHANVDRDLQDGEESSFEIVVSLSKKSLPDVTNPEMDFDNSSSSIASAFGLFFAFLGVVML